MNDRPDSTRLRVHELRAGATRLGHQWTLDHGLDAIGRREIELLLEIDPAALGQGGAPVTARSRLTCDERGRPILYSCESAGQRIELRFADTTVVAALPGGETLTIADIPADCVVLDGNLVGLTARVVADLAPDVDARFSAFLASQLVLVPYALTRAPELDRDELRGYRSSLQEELWLSASGELVELASPAHGGSARLIDPPPALPAWYDAAPPAPTPLHYVRPTWATATLVDITIAGPVTPIGGSLTLPPAPAPPRPGVLFLGGSGRHDRHGLTAEIDIGSHELLDRLGERDLVTLRCDTRGAGTTRRGEDMLDFGVDAMLRDAEACLDALRARPEVAPGGVWLIGHSEGGVLALALALARPAAVRGLVLMATPARPLDEVMAEQIEAFGRRRGLTSAQIERQIADLQDFVRAARDVSTWTEDQVPAHLLAGARSRRWLADHLRYRSDDMIARVRVPVLLCQGGKDLQVSPIRDTERLRGAALRAGVAAEVALFPDLDHLFKPVVGDPDPRQYYDNARKVDPGFIEHVARWIQSHES